MTRFSAITVLLLSASVSLAQEDSVKVKKARIQLEQIEKEQDSPKDKKALDALKEKQKEVFQKDKDLEKAKKDLEKLKKDLLEKAKKDLEDKLKDKVKQKDKDFEFRGAFKDTDPRDAQRQGPSQTHIIKMKAGQTYTIDMISSELDSYLRLLDSKDKQLDEDDDSGGMLNSRIIFNCSKEGDYKVVCTTFAANMTGNYLLTVKSNVNNQKPLSSHALLIGKDAADFKADFAVNGAPIKLADLKGKVVLLGFWEVRSAASAAMLPILSEWNKAYKADGLAIVGATFYTSDIGQKLGFDKETGRVTTAKQADPKSDQAVISDYASHHKIDHLLVALAKQDALAAFDAYAVNSLPQIVLIDRKGIVRMIHVGGLKNNADVENELKKLLTEK